MPANNYNTSRRIRYFITTTTAGSILVYAFLAFNAMKTAPITKSNRPTPQALHCTCPKDTEAPKPQVTKSLNPPSTTTEGDVRMSTPKTNYVPQRRGEFIQIAQHKSSIVLQDDFQAPDNAEEKENNASIAIGQKNVEVRSKFKHVVEPDPHRRKPNPLNQKGILTKFGYISLLGIDDHNYLSQKDVMMLADLFVYDQFPPETDNATKARPVVSFNNRTKRYDGWTNGTDDRIVRRPLCPMVPPNLKGKVSLGFNDYAPPSWLDIKYQNPEVKMGGRYTPPCHPRSKIAIIIPFRGRESQLQVLLAHMNPIWQRQQIDYTIYTISQVYDDMIFNKAKLMNIGYLEASKYDTYDCFVFHDVDMTLEDDRCLYRCLDDDNPRELSAHLDKFEYQELTYHLNCRPRNYPEWLYAKYFGGVAMMTEKQILDVNGYSNLFWGWGSEDIDMYLRLWKRGYTIQQPYGRRCSYHMIKHETETSNRKNDGRFALLANSVYRMRYEGLTSIRYKIVETERLHLYTNITVDVGRPKTPLVDFMSRKYSSFENQCNAQLPWE